MNNVQGNLFRPLILPNGLSLENRFVLSPMVTNSSTSEGFVTDDDIAYAVRRVNPLHYKLLEQHMLQNMVSYLNMVLAFQRMRTFLV